MDVDLTCLQADLTAIFNNTALPRRAELLDMLSGGPVEEWDEAGKDAALSILSSWGVPTRKLTIDE